MRTALSERAKHQLAGGRETSTDGGAHSLIVPLSDELKQGIVIIERFDHDLIELHRRKRASQPNAKKM